MTIEQVLMRAMKCTGGLTHGRGITESLIGKWVLSRVAILEVGSAMERFCNYRFSSSKQHTDNRISRISKNCEVLSKPQEFFATYNLFPDTDKLIGLYSGMIGDLKMVNCHKALEIGTNLMLQTSN